MYQQRLKAGIAREQARKDLPLSTYTEAYWKMDLKNLLHFMSLRCDSHAQLEIRSYANIIASIVKEICPLTFEAWYDYHFNSVSFSLAEHDMLLRYIQEVKCDSQDEVDWDAAADNYNLSKRERKEFWNKLNEQPLTKFDINNYEEYQNIK